MLMMFLTLDGIYVDIWVSVHLMKFSVLMAFKLMLCSVAALQLCLENADSDR